MKSLSNQTAANGFWPEQLAQREWQDIFEQEHIAQDLQSFYKDNLVTQGDQESNYKTVFSIANALTHKWLLIMTFVFSVWLYALFSWIGDFMKEVDFSMSLSQTLFRFAFLLIGFGLLFFFAHRLDDNFYKLYKKKQKVNKLTPLEIKVDIYQQTTVAQIVQGGHVLRKATFENENKSYIQECIAEYKGDVEAYNSSMNKYTKNIQAQNESLQSPENIFKTLQRIKSKNMQIKNHTSASKHVGENDMIPSGFSHLLQITGLTTLFLTPVAFILMGVCATVGIVSTSNPEYKNSKAMLERVGQTLRQESLHTQKEIDANKVKQIVLADPLYKKVSEKSSIDFGQNEGKQTVKIGNKGTKRDLVFSISNNGTWGLS